MLLCLDIRFAVVWDESNFTSNVYSRVYGLNNIVKYYQMSRIVVVDLRPRYVIVPKLNTQHMTDPWRDHSSGVLAISSTFSPSWILVEYWCTAGGVRTGIAMHCGCRIFKMAAKVEKFPRLYALYFDRHSSFLRKLSTIT